MRAELKAKWVAALRSGEYQQGVHRLYNSDTNSYCCLGVLCVVAGFEKVTEENGKVFFRDSNSGKSTGYGTLTETKDILEISWDQHDDLISKNDSFGWSFSQIADYIQEEL